MQVAPPTPPPSQSAADVASCGTSCSHKSLDLTLVLAQTCVLCLHSVGGGVGNIGFSLCVSDDFCPWWDGTEPGVCTQCSPLQADGLSDTQMRMWIWLGLVLVVPQVDKCSTFPANCYHIICIQGHFSVVAFSTTSMTAMLKHFQVAFSEEVAPDWQKKT